MTPKPFCEFRSVSIHRRERKERVRNTDTVHGHRHGFKASLRASAVNTFLST